MMSDSHISSSQEILFSSQSLIDDNNEYLGLSTQELVNTKSQEASNAIDFFDKLRDSQVVSQSTAASQSTDDSLVAQQQPQEDVKPDLNELNQRLGLELDYKPLFIVEKKKRGRKRKIRSKEEMELHLKDKKEKNRLAAQRLRQRKCSEVSLYTKECQEYEKKVQIKRNFAQHLESKVEQLRNRIKAMYGTNTSNSNNQNISNNNSNKTTGTNNTKTVDHFIKSESGKASNHLICISR